MLKKRRNPYIWGEFSIHKFMFILTGRFNLVVTSVREVWDSNPGPVKWDSVANGSPPLRRFFVSCVAQALSRGGGPRHSLHASA